MGRRKLKQGVLFYEIFVAALARQEHPLLGYHAAHYTQPVGTRAAIQIAVWRKWRASYVVMGDYDELGDRVVVSVRQQHPETLPRVCDVFELVDKRAL